MEQEEGKLLGRVEPGTSENLSNLVNGVVSVSETVILVNSEERDTVTVSKENEGLEVMGSDGKSVMGSEYGSNKILVDGHEQVVNKEIIDWRGSGEVSDRVDQGTSESSSNSVYGVVLETVVLINSDETLHVSGDNGGLKAKVNELGSSKVSVKEVKLRVSELEKKSCVIDVKCSSGKGFVENQDGERVCRICHLSSEQSSDATMVVTGNATTTTTTVTDLIQLGCRCKDELGIAHGYCAEAWFRLRGNRLCEICGETAKNITGVGDSRFMEEWNERLTVGSSSSSDRNGGCWRGQPFCNFLMACLVIAFVLPWFFRVNMF